MTHAPARPPHVPTLAGAYVVKKLRELDAAIVAAVPRVVESSDDEAIHDLRVAIRRLRTMLKMARPLFGRFHADVVRKSFADVMKATGDLRDEEVLEETLEGLCEHPAFTKWLRARKARERKLRRAVVARIERGELDRARLMLKALLVFPFAPERDTELSRFARRTVERARRVVEKDRDVSLDDALGLHELRISYKELRYAIELLSEALPLDARAMLEPAVVFQKRLGEIHDADVAHDVLTTAQVLPDEARDEALAALAKLREKRIRKYSRELDPLGSAAWAAPAKEELDPEDRAARQHSGASPELPAASADRAESQAKGPNGAGLDLDDAVTATSWDPEGEDEPTRART